jgi:DNA-binding FadR family transcriptional regulator
MNKEQAMMPRRSALSLDSAHASVAEAIGRRIMAGEFPAGTILPNEGAWGAEYGVSRSVVREAIKILAAKGLLTSRPRIGTRVEPRAWWNLLDHDVLDWYTDLPSDTRFLMSLQQFRRMFEPEAAALAAARRSAGEMDEIARACAAMGRAPDLAARGVADVQFHLAILRASGNELLLPLGVLIESTLRKVFVRINAAAGDLLHAQELHEAICAEIARQAPDAARAAVHHLLDNSDATIRRFGAAPV